MGSHRHFSATSLGDVWLLPKGHPQRIANVLKVGSLLLHRIFAIFFWGCGKKGFNCRLVRSCDERLVLLGHAGPAMWRADMKAW